MPATTPDLASLLARAKKLADDALESTYREYFDEDGRVRKNATLMEFARLLLEKDPHDDYAIRYAASTLLDNAGLDVLEP